MRTTIRMLVGLALLAAAVPASATFHLWIIRELYTNHAGNVQYLELEAVTGTQQFVAGHTITSTDGVTGTKSFTFPSHLPGDSAGKRMLIGTADFAALGVATPDFIVPSGFLYSGVNGLFTINFAENSDLWTNTGGGQAPPTDGRFALARAGGSAVSSPLNFGGAGRAILPLTDTMDLNGSGSSDLLYWNQSTGQVYRIAVNGGVVTSQGFVYTEPATNTWRIAAEGDFDGDGTTDLLWRNWVDGRIFMMPFSSAGVPAGGAVVYGEPNDDWQIAFTPDLNGDGRADILWRNRETGQLYALLMNGATIAGQGFVYTEPNLHWQPVAMGDFSGTGKVNQVVWRHDETGVVFLLTVNHSGSAFSAAGQVIYQEPNADWRIAATGDFNGDLRTDLLWRHALTGQVFMMLMNGPAIANAGFVYREPNLAWELVGTGDYDGDFKSDLLWRNSEDGRVYTVRMNGLAVAGARLLYQEADSAWRLMTPHEFELQRPSF